MARLKNPNEMNLAELEMHLDGLGDHLMEARQEAPSMVRGVRAQIKETKDLIKARKAGVKPDKLAKNTKDRPYATFDLDWLKLYVRYTSYGYAGYTKDKAKLVQAEIDLRAKKKT